MRNRLALLLVAASLLLAAGCSESATDRDRNRVLAMIETLRPEVEAALGDTLGVIEVTAVGEPERMARVLATTRAGTTEKLTRREFERRWSEGTLQDVFGGQDDPATDVEGNLYFRTLPAGDEELARSTRAALVRSYQVRTLELYPFLRSSSGEEERELRYRLYLRHSKFVRDRLARSGGPARRLILPGTGGGRPRCLANRTSRLAAAEFTAWDDHLAQYLSERFPESSPTEAFKRVFADPPRSIEEVTGLSTATTAYDLACLASAALWPELTTSVPTPILPEVVEAHFLTAGREAANRAGELVSSAFAVDAKHERGFVRVWAFETGSAAAVRELVELWRAEEQALDEACLAGTESEALLSAEYEEVEVAGNPGTLIRRIEENRDFLGLSMRPTAWRRPERLALIHGQRLLLIDLPYSLAFPTDALGVARQILSDGEDGAPWPEPEEVESTRRLTSGLGSESPQVRWWSLDGLAGNLTEDDPGFVILAPTLREERPEVLARVLAALGSWLEYVQFPVDDILPLLVRFCSHPDPEVRANAFRCLYHLESSERGAEAALLQGLADPVTSVRWYALGTWSGRWTEADPPPVDAVPTLIRMAKDPSSPVAWRAAAHLGQLNSSAADAVPLLITALSTNEEILRIGVSRALRNIGTSSPEVIGALRRVFENDESEEVTENAWWALKALTGEDIAWTTRFEFGE